VFLGQQPRFAPQSIHKRCQIAALSGILDLLFDKRLPGPAWIGSRAKIGLVFDEVLDKCGTSRPAIDARSHPGVECDGPIEQ
jgi:hypothetical protein